MNISIDPYSGFCFGVERAIKLAENELAENDSLYCLGDIVHNQKEIDRLNKIGFQTIDYDRYNNSKNIKVLIRAHGEPPSTYKHAKKNNIEIIDATCPVVLKLQQRIKNAYEEMKESNGQVIIFGKKNHPEIVGLEGQTGNTAIVVESSDDLDKLDYLKSLRLFVQTTKSTDDFKAIVQEIKKRISVAKSDQGNFKYYNTICGQVSNRVSQLKKFCRDNDVIIFVSGKKSSNGKYLYDICKSVNPGSHHISSETELEKNWFKNAQSVGISGATSTPKWLMEKVAREITILGYSIKKTF